MNKVFLKLTAQIIAILLCWSLNTIQAQEQTAPVIGLHQNVPNVVAFINARIVTAPGKVLENAKLIIRDDQIEAVGVKIATPPDAVVHDMKGKTIYPGFIDLFTNYGLTTTAIPKENPSVNGRIKNNIPTGAVYWNAAVHSQIQAVDMLREDKKAADIFRKCGFTTVLTLPSDGIFRGNGALVLLKNSKPNQAIIAADAAQAMSFSKGKSAGYPGTLMGSIALIRQTFLDVQWYEQAWRKYKKSPTGQIAPETNLSLSALQSYEKGQKPVIMKVTDELDILRAAKISDEFNLQMWIMGSGYEYRRLKAVKDTKLKLIIPLNFPKAPEVDTREKENNITLRNLKHWDAAPENPGRLASANVDFAMTSAFLKDKNDFLKKIRIAVKRGLPADKALKALTSTPASWLKMSHLLGSIEKGKLANFIVTDGNLFCEKTKIIDTWVAGERYKITELPKIDVRGSWSFTINTNTKTDTGTIIISGNPLKLKAKVRLQNKRNKVKMISLKERMISLSFVGDSIGYKGVSRITGMVEGEKIAGHGVWGEGVKFSWSAQLTKPWQGKADACKPKSHDMAEFPVVYPDGAFGRANPPDRADVLFIKDATIWTCGPAGNIEEADLIVKKGKIFKVGANLKAPSGAIIIDAAGKHITPGIIDAHAHLAISRGINESAHAVASEVRIKDVVNSADINIYRQLAGGVTTVCTLHGSANPIGGTYAVIKLRWGGLPDQLIINDAKEGIKFALGENVKQSNWGSSSRYPGSRMGIMEIIGDAFQSAKEYRHEWEIYKTKSKRNKNLIAPRKVLRYDAILEILDKKTIIHCHSYRQDEILAIIRLAEEMDFKVDVFIHVLEGYKVAEELMKHGAMTTIFSDWWAYKVEAYDAIPHNGAILHEQGVVVSFNSDSPELARRLNTEASKAVKYGNVPPEEAFKFVTLNAAKQLFLDHRIGSLEKGKDADFVIWNGSPLSTYSICEQTWIEGRKYFDREDDKKLRQKVLTERNAIVQKILLMDSQNKNGKENESKNKVKPRP